MLPNGRRTVPSPTAELVHAMGHAILAEHPDAYRRHDGEPLSACTARRSAEARASAAGFGSFGKTLTKVRTIVTEGWEREDAPPTPAPAPVAAAPPEREEPPPWEDDMVPSPESAEALRPVRASESVW